MSSPVLLIAFNHEPVAKLLIDYLCSQKIPAYYVVDPENAGHGVALRDPEDFSRAKVLAEEFMRDPGNQKYQKAAWEHGEQLSVTNKTGAAAFKGLWDFKSRPFTSLVFAICVVAFVLSLLGMFPQVRGVLQMQPMDSVMETGQWWRILTPAFLHFSTLHVVFNLLWWSMLGGQIEQKFGTSTLGLLFLVSAVVSNLGQYWMTGPNFGGLSGVVYAVVGFVWWVGWLKPQWGLSLPKPVIGFLLIWLVLGYADVLWVNMANTAHTLGLISGCLFAFILSKMTKKTDDPLIH